MNTNSNVYTILYTTLIVVVVAAVLAFAAMTLKPKQDANIKAETISQMLTAAGFSTKEDLAKLSNEKILEKYAEVINTAFLIDAEGRKIADLDTELGSIELADNLKLQNSNIKNGKDVELPVYVFDKDGEDLYVVPVYGAGLWGPVWGYIAFDEHCDEIVGAYFDHESETPGLGAKIKDESWFRDQFKGELINMDDPDNAFDIVKGGSPAGVKEDSKVDAITGATMTCKGLDAAIDTWLKAYMPFFKIKVAAAAEDDCDEDCEEEGHEHHHHNHDPEEA
ncbi:MAG: NADH:ubiquinone reductase (Na(+)-transporting) subunit C [Bacteroidales bacterium]|nr:NADH:ubiquinone reductase (Na(+)-transporting) subunit C [Bacteroidales bacterium]